MKQLLVTGYVTTVRSWLVCVVTLHHIIYNYCTHLHWIVWFIATQGVDIPRGHRPSGISIPTVAINTLFNEGVCNNHFVIYCSTNKIVSLTVYMVDMATATQPRPLAPPPHAQKPEWRMRLRPPHVALELDLVCCFQTFLRSCWWFKYYIYIVRSIVTQSLTLAT